MTIKKPIIKTEWRGQQGNKFRVYIVTTPEGNKFVHLNKADAMRQYNAGVSMYNVIKTRKHK